MSKENLLEARRLCTWVDVPDLEFTAKGTNKKVVSIDLVQISWILLVVNLMSNRLASCLNIDIDNEHLLVVETGDCQNRG